MNQQEEQKKNQDNLSNQNTDDNGSVDSIEFTQQYPNITHILRIKDQCEKIMLDIEQKENLFKIEFKGIELEITFNPPSKGDIRFYKEEWETVIDPEVGCYCVIKNITKSENENIVIQIYDTPNKDILKKEILGQQQQIKVESICDNDYKTRDWESIHLIINDKKYTIDTLIKNPLHKE